MKYRLLDILACPMCKGFPLSLQVLEVEAIHNPTNVHKCEMYCSFHNGAISDLKETNCEDCYRYEIRSGVLSCGRCGRWYPIIEEIPIMLPDEMRDKRRDIAFLEKWRDKLSPDIIRDGKPYGLVGS